MFLNNDICVQFSIVETSCTPLKIFFLFPEKVSEIDQNIELSVDQQWERVNFLLILVAVILIINATVLFSWIIILYNNYSTIVKITKYKIQESKGTI